MDASPSHAPVPGHAALGAGHAAHNAHNAHNGHNGHEAREAHVARARPELLAPAGDRDCLLAAIENGADAVYFGLNHGFNARVRAANFALADLPEIMALLHHRGLKGYVTLNTLIFPEELSAVEQTVGSVAAAGVDAVLVQDLGLVTLIREICPDLPIHASTQMTLSSAECIRAVEQLGVERVVLARELAIDEIRMIHRRTSMPLEAFVHGALCVAYSGQCLTSESLGGRSANRGQCAQACRLPYDLLCDGKDVDLGDVKYLLSPQDLAAFELVPDMIEAGVMSFKIEGRLKTPEYVANITRRYREAIDMALAGRRVQFAAQQVEEMALSFSRGFSPGWLQGCDHKMLVPGLSSAKRGVPLGEITQVRRNRVQLRLIAEIKPGDGIVFDGDRSRNQEQGGRVFAVYRGRSRLERAGRGELVELAFGRESIDLQQLYVGQRIWKTDDPALTRRLRKSFSGPDPQRRIGLHVRVRAVVGSELTVSCHTDSGLHCEVHSGHRLGAAVRRPASKELLRTQLGRLGGTPYELATLEAELGGTPMIPLSVLGKLRHALVERLDQSAQAAPPRRISESGALRRLRERRTELAGDGAAQRSAAGPRLHVLCRSLEQIETLLDLGAANLLADFQDIRQYRDAVKRCRAAGAAIFLATPRIQKPRETGIFRVLARHGADGILVRNLAGLQFFAAAGIPLVADFSLNAANDLTVDYLRRQGAQRVTVSYDLNRDQLTQLIEATPTDWLELVVHQHMPMFHMEHCVFCAVLSPGTNKTNCGRPCDRHQVLLRDRIGMEHPLKADVGCRNTLFNAVPQSAAEAVPALIAAGLRDFRIELLDEQSSELRQVFQLYRELLEGRIQGKEVWLRLRAANRVGVTRGTLEERRNPLALL
jgi:U32 family peptidase